MGSRQRWGRVEGEHGLARWDLFKRQKEACGHVAASHHVKVGQAFTSVLNFHGKITRPSELAPLELMEAQVTGPKVG